MQRKSRRRELRISRVVMQNRRHATQQILQSAEHESIRTRHSRTRSEHRVAAATCVDVGRPMAGIFVVSAEFHPRIVIAMQVVVRIDEARHQTVALQIDDAVLPFGSCPHRNDT